MSNTVALNQPTGVSPTLHAAESTPTPQITQASTPQVKPPLQTALGDKADLQTLGLQLNTIATQLGKSALPAAVFTALNTAFMPLHPDSTHPKDTTGRVSLAAFIQSLGLTAPTNHFSLTGLAKAVSDRAQEHPLGNLGGALAWPVPLNADEQARLRSIAMRHAHHLGDQPLVMQTKGGILEFLRLHLPLSAQILNDPERLLDALLCSPQAQLMGKALQQNMQGIATPTSSNDYLLAAIALQLDPESITAPHRNKVAGFDLADPQLIGKPASAVLDSLIQHLISQGKTSPAMAGVAARLLLAARAPVFLIKDIPSSVTVGSPAWLNLAVAAATLEAQTPGRVGNMTFAQVMLEAESAAYADPSVTRSAQQAALLDWGVANGVLARKNDDQYTPEDLAVLIQAFTARNQLMMSAAKVLDTELPSRREMALAALKQRFPGKEALFEEKLISVMTRRVTHTEGGKGVGYNHLLTGKHSMLDIAMMKLKHPDLVFRCKDSRVPIDALNANNQIGVEHEFEQQFDQAIQDKKTAVGTTVKHLIAKLPLEDRKNFEYGTVSFLQNTSHRLGLGFADNTPLPPGQELLVSITREGVTTAYEINVAKGLIVPVSTALAAERESRSANVVHQTKAFGAVLNAPTGTQSAGGVPDSFVSSRTQAIADTFVSHLNLDNPQIRAHARGLTSEDRRVGLAEHVGDFLLNLIPFRSAIINFQKGHYGDGAFDLALDVFGFLTAGLGVAGKVAKVGASAVSAANKALNVAKVIGAATISALNPLSGLGDLTVGAARLTGSGLKFVSAKALEGVNKLRGAAGNYDLLKAASKEHGPTLIGSYKMGGVDTEGVAVLKDGHWYKYDHVANRPYGSPIEHFSPRGQSYLNGLHAGSGEPEYLKLHRNLSNATMPTKKPEFDRGYLKGRLEDIPGYQPGMNSKRLLELAEVPGRSAEQMGTLSRELKRAFIDDAAYVISLMSQDVQGKGVSLFRASQISYNAHVDLPSVGECAGLSYGMALALQSGKEEQFLKNMLKATDKPVTPGMTKFVSDLRGLQDKVQQSSSFHFPATPQLVGYDEIIDKMAKSTTSTTIKISERGHGMLAGVRFKDGKPEWFFYDPNAGLVKFTDFKAMEAAMENVLNSGLMAAMRNTERTLTGQRAYSISTFTPSDLNQPGIDVEAVTALSSVAL